MSNKILTTTSIIESILVFEAALALALTITKFTNNIPKKEFAISLATIGMFMIFTIACLYKVNSSKKQPQDVSISINQNNESSPNILQNQTIENLREEKIDFHNWLENLQNKQLKLHLSNLINNLQKDNPDNYDIFINNFSKPIKDKIIAKNKTVGPKGITSQYIQNLCNGIQTNQQNYIARHPN